MPTFFFLFPFFFQQFLCPPMDTSPLQTCLTALCLQISHPCSLSEAIWQVSQLTVDFRRKFTFNFLLVNSDF